MNIFTLDSARGKGQQVDILTFEDTVDLVFFAVGHFFQIAELFSRNHIFPFLFFIKTT